MQLVSTQMPMVLTIPVCTSPTSKCQHCDFAWWLVHRVLLQESWKFWVINCKPLPPFPAAFNPWCWELVDRCPCSLTPGTQLFRGRGMHFSLPPRVPQQGWAPLAHSGNLLNNVLFTGFLPFCLISSLSGASWNHLPGHLLHLNPCLRVCFWGDPTKAASC